ncbi:unnamed protein product [Caenorhabditis angaria]|uniref:Uncharacterized protein n=1 Tax=Caenorhabditis angaria TaxID=860376 RepID=A0A9P1IDU7_9PELO|nr:unnamed protein product [Caenorhabditis angaria]
MVLNLTSLLLFYPPIVKLKYNSIEYNLPILIDLDLPVTKFLWWVYCTELFVIFLSLVFMKWVMCMIYSIVVIHRNLRYMLIFHLIHYWIGGIARLYLLCMQMHIVTDRTSIFNMFASFGRFQFFSYAICAASGIAVERIFATYFVLDYETRNRTWIIVTCCIYLFTHANVFFTIPLTFSNIPIIYIALYFFITIILAKLITVKLYNYNLKELEKLNWKIANNRQLVYTHLDEIGVAFALSVLFSLGCILVICSLLGTDNFSGHVTVVIIDFLIAGSGIILPALCVYIVRRENASNKLKSKIRCIRRNAPEFNTVLKQSRIASISNATHTYFDELQKSWK